MAALAELIGAKLVGKDGQVDTATALAGKKCVAIYFSAHWCPPCRGFTPQLAEWYTKDLKAKGMEVIFASSDKSEDEFTEYYGGMPWLSLPYSDRATPKELNNKYKVQGIPSVVILGPDGELMTKDGRSALSDDPTGEDMPWKPQTFAEVFAEAKLVGPGGIEKKGNDLLGNTVLGLYFSAHWCPPCRGFTPKLAEWYSSDLKKKGLEVVFISSDRDEAAFKEYAAEQPWLALDFADRKRKKQLSDIFKVEGIPSFVILDKDGSVITAEGREALSNDPKGDNFPWYPPPVANLKSGPGKINDISTLIAFCETCDAATQQAIQTAMEPLATKLKDAAKSKGEDDPEVAFIIAVENGEISSQLRSMLQLPALPPIKHEHPLVKSDRANGWGCDGCGQSGAGKDRYRCDACDFDLCGDCQSRVGQIVSLPPKLMMVDIPDEGGYYEGPEGDVTEAVIQQFVDNFTAKKLTRKQLQ